MSKIIKLLADIGGTNARFSILEGGELKYIDYYSTKEYKNLLKLIADYYVYLKASNFNPDNIKEAYIGVAGFVFEDNISLTNSDFSFSISKVKKKFKFEKFVVVNDLQAHAYSIPLIEKDNLIKIKKGKSLNNIKAMIGIGTGLGSSFLVSDNEAFACEAGHSSIGFITDEQKRIIEILKRENVYLTVEDLLSGRGLVNIYYAVCDILGCDKVFETSEEVINSVLEKGKISSKALNIMCEFLGIFVRDFIISYLAFGGVYIKSNIFLEKYIVEFLKKSKFKDYLLCDCKFKDMIDKVPIYLVNKKGTALLGLKNLAGLK